MRSRYRGVTYPPILGRQPFFWLWRRICCPREMHLLDEVESLSFGRHALVCDACQLQIGIAGFDTRYLTPTRETPTPESKNESCGD